MVQAIHISGSLAGLSPVAKETLGRAPEVSNVERPGAVSLKKSHACLLVVMRAPSVAPAHQDIEMKIRLATVGACASALVGLDSYR